MKTVRNILLIALALLVQSTVFGRLDLFGVRPDLALMVLLFLAAETDGVGLICYGFLIGFLQDVYSPEYLGFNAFSMSLTAFVLDVLKERLTVENFTVKLVTTLLACMFHDIVYLGFYTGFAFSSLVSIFVGESLPGAVYTSVLAVLVIGLWRWANSGGLFVVLREFLECGR